MIGRKQGIGRMGRGRRTMAIGAAVAAVATAAALIGSAGSALASPRVMPAMASVVTDGSGAPAGWAPVPYERAKLSVPGSWLIEGPKQLWCAIPNSHGMIFVGIKPRFPKSLGCKPTPSRAWIVPAGKLPKGIGDRKPTAVINGIPVYRLTSAKGSLLYLVPKLGVRVGARGTLARRVLDTLTRSPLSVVLRRGQAASVPASWTWRTFGGVRFAAPPAWDRQREKQWATCGTGLEPGTLLLVDAVKPPVYLPCPLQIPTASAYQAQPGLTVVTGKYAAKSVGGKYVGCQRRSGVRICLSTITGEGGFASGVLMFTVSRPGHARAFFLLGLSGSGAGARTVFGSITAART